MLVVGHSWSTGVYPTTSIAFRLILLQVRSPCHLRVPSGPHMAWYARLSRGLPAGQWAYFSQGLAPYRSSQGELLIYLGSSRLPRRRSSDRAAHLPPVPPCDMNIHKRGVRVRTTRPVSLGASLVQLTRSYRTSEIFITLRTQRLHSLAVRDLIAVRSGKKTKTLFV